MHPVTISHPNNDAAAESEAWMNDGSVIAPSDGSDSRGHIELRLEGEEVAGRGR